MSDTRESEMSLSRSRLSRVCSALTPNDREDATSIRMNFRQGGAHATDSLGNIPLPWASEERKIEN